MSRKPGEHPHAWAALASLLGLLCIVAVCGVGAGIALWAWLS